MSTENFTVMMHSSIGRRFSVLLCLVAFLAAFLALGGCSDASSAQPDKLDKVSRLAVISAFEPELALLRKEMQQEQSFTINGISFTTGVLAGKPVVVFLSGISMVNAAMTTQVVLDRFNISHIVFSGIAGGVNPDLHIGDVTVAQRWGQYFETLAAREIAPGQYAKRYEGDADLGYPGFGLFFTRPVKVSSAAQPQPHQKFWFEVDPEMLAIARRVGNVALSSCSAQGHCLGHTPSVNVGGNGVSAAIFVDNAALRQHLHEVFEANVVDMESAACAAVAYSNGVPFIAFRSLSDLAGGGKGANEMHTFLDIAADNSAKVLLAFLEAWK